MFVAVVEKVPEVRVIEPVVLDELNVLLAVSPVLADATVRPVTSLIFDNCDKWIYWVSTKAYQQSLKAVLMNWYLKLSPVC